MTDDMEFPHLTPHDDRYPSPGRLIRRPDELTDEQFDLLAAAWSENDLTGDGLAEMEAIMAADTSRRERAVSFRQVRLTPMDEKWENKNRMMKHGPALITVRNSLLIGLVAAASITIIILLGPLASRQAQDNIHQSAHPISQVAEAVIPAASPIIIDKKSRAETSLREALPQVMPVTVQASTEPQQHQAIDRVPQAGIDNSIDRILPVSNGNGIDRISQAGIDNAIEQVMPVNPGQGYEIPPLIAAEDYIEMIGIEYNQGLNLPVIENEKNWIFRGLAQLTRSGKNEEKEISGYTIASACVTGINTFLGWEMELRRVFNEAGKTASVNFSSSILSFSAPINKPAL